LPGTIRSPGNWPEEKCTRAWGLAVYHDALRRGAYLRPLGNVVYIAPPLSIADADLDELLAIVADSVRAVTRSG